MRIFGLALLLLLSSRAWADDPAWRLGLEGGAEVDTNVHRTTGGGVAASGARGAIRLDLAVNDPLGALHVDALAAGQAFAGTDPSSEDISVVAANLRAQKRIGDLAPGLRLAYYDAFQAGDHAASMPDDTDLHDFRTGDVAATLGLAAGENRITAAAGYRFFTYKPDPTFDFGAAQVGLTLNRRLSGDADPDAPAWDLALAYSIDRRAYDSRALADLCPDGSTVQASCLADGGAKRADLFHDAAVEIAYSGKRLYAARYSLQVNDSNSFGQSLVRHRLDLTTTTGLFADIYLNVRVVLQLNQFTDGLLFGGDVGTFTTIEDETRNAVILHATREVGDAWTVEARYAYYQNPFATAGVSYARHTVYLGLVYSFRSTPR